MYSLNTRRLARANGIGNVNRIHTGQVLDLTKNPPRRQVADAGDPSLLQAAAAPTPLRVVVATGIAESDGQTPNGRGPVEGETVFATTEPSAEAPGSDRLEGVGAQSGPETAGQLPTVALPTLQSNDEPEAAPFDPLGALGLP